MEGTVLALTVLCALVAGCRGGDGRCTAAGRTLRIATTTSLDNTGLLGALLPPFERRTGIEVEVLAVGSGQALQLARNGDVDAVLVHDEDAEMRFLQEGSGLHRTTILRNDFVLVGPPEDPAAARGLRAAEAFRRIAMAASPFVSRGDRSGTHAAELRIWERAKIAPGGQWYLIAGQGMRHSLSVADERRAYCLCDRASYLVAREDLDLSILVEGDAVLGNPYSFIAVDPARHPQAKLPEALALLGWLESTEGRRIIAGFAAAGRQLFSLR